MGNQLQLEYLQEKRDGLEKEAKQTRQEIKATVDITIKQTLENRLNLLFEKIDHISNEISELETTFQREEERAADHQLIEILQSHPGSWSDIERAYKATLIHWAVRNEKDVSTGQVIVNKLKAIPPGKSSYNALNEFIVHLMNNVTDSNSDLIGDLVQWRRVYRNSVDWSHIDEQIQDFEAQQVAQVQPALLIAINRAELESAKSQEKCYYQLKAWLVRDVETYRKHQRGYYPLIQTDTPEAEPRLLEDLTQQMTRLLNQFLSEKNRLCRNCLNDPEVHVFLPMELMYLEADAWPLDDRRPILLGHDYTVVIHCAERYQDSYRKRSAWLRLWQQHQVSLQKLASEVFTSGCDVNLDELADALNKALEAGHCVGLKLTQAPCTSDPCDLFYELLQSALPLAIWGRSNLTQASTETELNTVLMSGCLEKLPWAVKRKRSEAQKRKNSPDCHIGHHLSLLWDDPYLDIPKKSA